LALDVSSHLKARARFSLAQLLWRSGDLVQAAAEMTTSLSWLPERERADAHFTLLRLLQARLAQLARLPARELASDGEQNALRQQVLERGSSFVASYPRHVQRGDVIVYLIGVSVGLGRGQVAAQFVDRFVDEYGTHARYPQVMSFGLELARKQKLWPRVYRLVERSGCLNEGRGTRASAFARKCPTWRSQAADAARRQAVSLVSGPALDRIALDARRWLQRARKLLPPLLRGEIELLEAKLAIRLGNDGEALARLRAATAVSTVGLEGKKLLTQALVVRAQLHLARGQLRQSAEAYLRAAKETAQLDQQLEMMAWGIRLMSWGGRREAASQILRELRRRLSQPDALPPAVRRRWIRRVGELVELSGGRAYAYYLSEANRSWRDSSSLAAHLLLEAARLAPRRRRSDLYRQAINLSGRLRRNDRVVPMAVGARLAWAQAYRRSFDRRKVDSPAALGDFLSSMSEVLYLRHPRHSAAAGLQMSWALGVLANIVKQRQAVAGGALARALGDQARSFEMKRRLILETVAKLARQPGGLNRHTMTAVSLAAGRPAIDRLGHFPEQRSVTRDVVVARLQANEIDVAAAIVDGALALTGPRKDLLCLRASVHFAAGQPELAVRALDHGLKLDSGSSRCLRLNQAAIAYWRGSENEARRWMAGVAGPLPSNIDDLEPGFER
jgi:hypothetical protein